MAEDSLPPDPQSAVGGSPLTEQSAAATGAMASSAEPGAPIPPDAVDPELLRLPVPLPRRQPLLAVAVLIVGVLLLYRLRTDLRYALESAVPRNLGPAVSALASGQLPSAIDHHVALSGLPDHRNSLAFEFKGARSRMQAFRLLGSGSRIFVSTPAAGGQLVDRFSGRLRRLDDLSYAETLRTSWQQMQVLRALDLKKLEKLPAGPLAKPLSISDRAGEPLSINAEQDLLIDVLFDSDLRVLLAKDKYPSEADARHEVERLNLAHGPGVETKDGYGYVLRLPSPGPERQRLLAQIDDQGIWLWHRVETYRVPMGAVQVTPVGLAIPGPHSLPQPVRYQPQLPAAALAPNGAPNGAPGGATADALLLVPQKEPNTLLLWEQLQAVQVSEALSVPADALLLVSGETPSTVSYTLPLAMLLLLFMVFNIWYLARALRRD
jgi:hypothetical protein